MFDLKKHRGVVSRKMTYVFKESHKEFDEQAVESKVDRSSVYNALIEGMCILDKIIPSNFNFLDFPLLV